MATTFYGMNLGGQDAGDVTIDTSTTSSDIELAIDDTNLAAGSVAKKHFIAIALEALDQAVQEDAV